jgi:pyridine nucleotide-disulfide oxidoreductase family protein
MTGSTRLLLVGGGHAHLEILRRLILEPRNDVEPVLVSDSGRQHYSGMVPGFVRGRYSEAEIAVELAPLATRAGGVFVKARALRVDAGRRVVRLDDGRDLPYDLVSFNIGSVARGASAEDVSRNALSIKPIARAVDLRENLRELARSSTAPLVRVVIVGAGAAGVEIACAVAAVLDDTRHSRDVTIADASTSILEGYSDAFRARAKRVLEKKHVRLRLGAPVTRVEAGWVVLEGETRLLSELTIWLTGPAAPDLFRESGLRTDDRGFLLVDDSLRSVAHHEIFGAGDCASLASSPRTPKAGVYAVREAPVLWKSLTAAIDGGPRPKYEPQRIFLSILNTADGRGLLRWGPLVSWSRAALLLKERIDRAFVGRYQSLAVS